MAKLIRNRRVAADSWLLLRPSAAGAAAGTDGGLPFVPAEGDVIVSLAQWQAQKDALSQRKGRTGVWLQSNEGPEAIAADLDRLPLVAVDFPSIGDGRGYTTARLLRERYGYKGEVRATGAVLKDTLLGMQRCGIDSFLLREGEDVDDALTAFDELPVAYQANALEPQPLFRRRGSATGAAGG